MAQYKVVEKFISINGEGVLAGQLAVFIRFQGCNLRCSYCDTMWANEEDAPFTLMSENEIYNYIKETGVKNITLTGGEPLLVPDFLILLKLLGADEFLHIEIETNGSVGLNKFFGLSSRISFTMDYKLESSKMEDNMLTSNFDFLTKNDTVKFVAGDTKDLNRIKEIVDSFNLTKKCNVYISPVFGKIDLEEIVNFLIKNLMNDVTLQVQMHKIIWDPNQKGV